MPGAGRRRKALFLGVGGVWWERRHHTRVAVCTRFNGTVRPIDPVTSGTDSVIGYCRCCTRTGSRSRIE